MNHIRRSNLILTLILLYCLLTKVQGQCFSYINNLIPLSGACDFALSVYAANSIVYVSCFNNIIMFNSSLISVTIANSTQCPGSEYVSTDIVNNIVYATCSAEYPNNANQARVIAFNKNNGVITVLASYSQCPSPIGLYVDTSRRIVYVSCMSSTSVNGIIAINTTSHIVTTLISVTPMYRPSECVC